jgi:hypothetical protein
MNQLENLFAESFSSSSEILDGEAPVNFIQKAQMHACDRFQDLVILIVSFYLS